MSKWLQTTKMRRRKLETLYKSEWLFELINDFRLPGLSHKPAAGQVNVPAKGSMPLPPGLIPTGTFADTKPMSAIPKPANSAFPEGGSSGLKSLQSQYEPLDWTSFFDSQEKIDGRIPVYIAGTEGHVFVCLHGAGHSAMSFAALAADLKTQSTVVAFDFRGHGQHYCDNETDLS